MSTKKDNNVCFRLKRELKRLKIGYAEVAGVCDVSEKTVGRWCATIPVPSDKLALLAPLGVDLMYVLTGGGEANRVAEAATEYAQGVGAVSREEEGVLEMYRDLQPADRAHARAVIGAFACKKLAKKRAG